MSDSTPRLKLPELAQMQELNAATLNEALAQLDAVTDLYLKGRFIDTPPSAPADGDTYLLGAAPTGAWSGRAYKIAHCLDGAWRFFTPFDGLRAAVASSGAFIFYQDGAWKDFLPPPSGAETSVASAATCDIGSPGSLCVAVTGTITITSFGSVADVLRFVRFAGALTLTHNAASLMLLGGASRVTAANDVGLYRSDAGGNWRELFYARAAVNAGDAATKTGSETLTNKMLVAPALGAATGASLSLGGAALGSNALAVTGSAAVSGTVTAGALNVVDTALGTVRAGVTGSKMGYGTTYGAVVLGAFSGSNRVVALGIDPSTITGSNFGAGGAGIILPYATKFMLPNTAGTNWIAALEFDGDGGWVPGADNTQNIGAPSRRMKTIYAATGSINTSDAREKWWRADAVDAGVLAATLAAEYRAARRITKELGGFKFLSSIALKGLDGARIHFGPRAQMVRDILVDEGLDPSVYSWLCHDAWAETPAVEEVEEIRDPETDEVLQAAVKGAPVVPGGDRWGLRYEGLFAFLLIAVDRRQDEQEARLENANNMIETLWAQVETLRTHHEAG